MRTLEAVASWAVLVLAGLSASAACVADERIKVRVERRGDTVVIDVDAAVDASTHDAWEGMTDYDRMASFTPNLRTSRVVQRQGDVLTVAQSGQKKVAFMTFRFELLRSVELVPMSEIRSHLIKGDFRSYVSVTRLVAADSRVRIVHHGEYTPTAWLPPMIGPALIETETRKQYEEVVKEILRRARAKSAPGS